MPRELEFGLPVGSADRYHPQRTMILQRRTINLPGVNVGAFIALMVAFYALGVDRLLGVSKYAMICLC